MNPSIRSVPDLPITDLLARAYGVRPTCYASMRGDSCEIRLDSGASLVIEVSNGQLETTTRFPAYSLTTMDELRERQRDTEVLVRWAEFVTTYAQHHMMRHDITRAMEIVNATGIDDSDEDFVRQIGDLAAAQEIGLEGDFAEAIEGFISLALTLRELDALAAAEEHHLPPLVRIDMPTTMNLCGQSAHVGL